MRTARYMTILNNGSFGLQYIIHWYQGQSDLSDVLWPGDRKVDLIATGAPSGGNVYPEMQPVLGSGSKTGVPILFESDSDANLTYEVTGTVFDYHVSLLDD